MSLIVFAVAALVYLGYEYSKVIQRKQWLIKHYQQAPFSEASTGWKNLVQGGLENRPSVVRRVVLGDQTIPQIEVLKDTAEKELKEISETFPEADIGYVPDRRQNQPAPKGR